MYKQFKYALLPGVIASTLILTACGGSSSTSGNPGGNTTDVLARGPITAATDVSMTVAGVEWETPENGVYTDDDVPASGFGSDDTGKVVTLKGERNDDGVSGTVTEVEYEAEIEGTADADGKINGVSFIIDDKTNTSSAPSVTANALVENQRYEVSGFSINDTTIHATFIKHDDDGDVVDEVKGVVDAVDATSITVNGVVYQYNDADQFFSVGNIVEIHFTPGTPNVANLVELEDELFSGVDDGQEVEKEGAVNLTAQDLADLCPAGDTFFLIDATCIDYSAVPTNGWFDGLTGPDDLVSGLRVEAEGHFNAQGVLVAEKIKGRGNQVRAEALATAITSTDGVNGTLTLFAGSIAPIEVTFQDGITEIEFGEDTDLSNAGETEGLKIRGIRTGDSSILALRIRDEKVDPDKQELRAEVDDNGANEVTNTISVMGITSRLTNQTELEDEDTTIAAGNGLTTETQIDDFLSMIDDDGIVSVGNGPNDVVEIRIDTTGAGDDGSSVNPYAADQVEIEREDD